ncbi:MAG: hypothetical protein ACREIE_09545, partial [Nitrospiraceae bacterium]
MTQTTHEAGGIRAWRLGTSLAVTAGVLLVLLLTFTYLTYRDILNDRRNAEIENTVAIGRAMAGEVDAFLADLESVTLAITVGIGAREGAYTQPAVGPYLKRVIENSEGLRALFVTDRSGRV